MVRYKQVDYFFHLFIFVKLHCKEYFMMFNLFKTIMTNGIIHDQ